jgi:hypothetical protein
MYREGFVRRGLGVREYESGWWELRSIVDTKARMTETHPITRAELLVDLTEEEGPPDQGHACPISRAAV